jgi:hypothetical protein
MFLGFQHDKLNHKPNYMLMQQDEWRYIIHRMCLDLYIYIYIYIYNLKETWI